MNYDDWRDVMYEYGIIMDYKNRWFHPAFEEYWTEGVIKQLQDHILTQYHPRPAGFQIENIFNLISIYEKDERNQKYVERFKYIEKEANEIREKLKNFYNGNNK